MRAILITMIVAIGLLGAQQSPGTVWDPEPNKLGIYFDHDGYWAPYGDANMGGGVVTAYILLTNPTFGELHRWEAAMKPTGSQLIPISESIEGGGVNTSVGEMEFVVSYDTPVTTEQVTVLASVQLFPISPSRCLILTGVSNPSLPEDLPLVWPEVDSPMVIETSEIFF